VRIISDNKTAKISEFPWIESVVDGISSTGIDISKSESIITNYE